MLIEFLRSLVRIRLVGSTFWQKKSKGIKGKEKKSKKKERKGGVDGDSILGPITIPNLRIPS